MKLLIAYATTDGMTARIAKRIAEAVRGAGCEADVVDTATLPKGSVRAGTMGSSSARRCTRRVHLLPAP